MTVHYQADDSVVVITIDRLSSYQQWERPLPDALTREYLHGMATLHTGET